MASEGPCSTGRVSHGSGFDAAPRFDPRLGFTGGGEGARRVGSQQHDLRHAQLRGHGRARRGSTLRARGLRRTGATSTHRSSGHRFLAWLPRQRDRCVLESPRTVEAGCSRSCARALLPQPSRSSASRVARTACRAQPSLLTRSASACAIASTSGGSSRRKRRCAPLPTRRRRRSSASVAIGEQRRRPQWYLRGAAARSDACRWRLKREHAPKYAGPWVGAPAAALALAQDEPLRREMLAALVCVNAPRKAARARPLGSAAAGEGVRVLQSPCRAPARRGR